MGETKEEVGPVTILVNNAGIVSGNTILDTPDNKIVKTFEVNVFAHFWTIKAFLPDMIASKSGHVMNIASLAGHAGANKLVDYCSSKYAADKAVAGCLANREIVLLPWWSMFLLILKNLV